MLAKRFNSIRNILLAIEEEAKQLAGSLLISKSVWFQTEYMGTWRTRVTVHRVPANITEDQLSTYFSKFGLVEDISPIMDKADIATMDFVLQVTMN